MRRPPTPTTGLLIGSTLSAALLAGTALLAPPASAASVPGQDPVGGPLLAARGVVAAPGPEADPLPTIRAKAWVLADVTTGEVLAAKNAHLALPPASTLKTLTALTLLPRLDPDDVYTARWTDVAVEGSHVGIVTGGTYTVHDLFNGLILPSGNDAATALAHANGGLARTVAQMNAEAQRLQAHDTVAKNPSGLDAPGQVSSAYDLALIARAGLAREDFAAYAARVSADFPGQMPKKEGKKRPTFRIYTQNRLLLHGYEGAVGLKTGYTTNAGRTFVGAARRDGHTLVVALMRITDWSETAATTALDWGFANRDRVSPVGTLVDPLPASPDVGTSTGGAATGEEVPAALPVAPAAGEAAGQEAVLAAEVGPASGSSVPRLPLVLWVLSVLTLLVATVVVLRVRARARQRRRRLAAAGRHARVPA